jgi:steroid delta-isomerase-like uncharacterized protein
VSVEENKAVVRKLEAALNAGRADAGLEVWAEDLLFNGRRISPRDIARLRASLWDAVPDLRWTMEQLVAEGDWVAVRWTMRGTNTGEHPGGPPATGRQVEVTGYAFYRLEGGRLREQWAAIDRLDVLQQLGQA